MTDYRHELQFGSFITPANADPRHTVELAVASERAGLDLVTFQDHPYQPRFLDTWTLLSYVAARTERVHLAPNVLNLPLRPPAVVARAAASLDLLSGGRFELGLGAGAFWDAIAAMGGRRLAPAEAVAALGEAINVVRGIWDVDAGTVLRVAGTVHAVDGAKRGPRPAHAIGIWLGAYKPRMLRLTGEKADGWLPSLGGWPSTDDLAAANALIDEAATAAGRRPADVRRLLNIGALGEERTAGLPPTPVEMLTTLALEHGFGTFILASDDEAELTRYGQEVAPAVREAVAAGRR
ncbi:LLM class flavin-dependent oxidoreductase [Geodermatophilus sp. YIM 151500]|uniref:LLM class flavin-dependent oxidoreductase n=1 Tax=Geodermatophilus sp. YIM 151500 TaxID=2984531 RepID=UPI0021E4CCCF|nr:LLM class flavin-dependent oxidoreductase [Geodermatophilus sp. YIM 151500]MCV2490738.1 LLM class flavin-dependent oxidoreductase [Geodermatophilus sp. YIM 151500]